MKMENELKPCPFCGSKDVELRAGALFNGAVHCNNCSADVVFDAIRMIAESDYDWKTAVTNGWNNRAKLICSDNAKGIEGLFEYCINKFEVLGVSFEHINFMIDEKEYILHICEVKDGEHWSEKQCGGNK